MKKIIQIICVLFLVMIFFGCGSSPSSESSGGIPRAISRARSNAPEDVLVGIGSSSAQSLNTRRNTAATRARAEISQAMNSMVQNMVRDYTASSEVDPGAAMSFQENITVSLSRSNLSGAIIKEELEDANGNYWVVMYLSKTSVVREINQAQAAARLAVPAMASFNAEARMNEAFDRAKNDN